MRWRFPVDGYVVAVVATAAVGIVRFALADVVGEAATFLPFALAVMIAAWYGGWKPGLLATLLSALTSLYLFVPPYSSLRIVNVKEGAGLAVFLINGFAVCWLCETLHAARRRLEAEQVTRRSSEERERARLQAKEAELELVTETTPLILARCSRDLRYLFANRAAAALFGLTPQQMIGRRIAEIMDERAFALIQPHIEQVLRGEPVVYEAQIPYQGVGPRWVRVSYMPDRDRQGNVAGWVASITDITERKQAEEALREADRRKDEFLATLAHELRNPLAPIRNAIRILQLQGPPAPELQWARDVIERQMQQMTRLIDDLLDVSRITRNRLELRKELVELASVLHGAVETSRPLLDGSSHELSLSQPPEPVYIEADPTRLTQVFSNLLNNAAKYSEPKGRISLTAEYQGRDVVVSVRDHGIGIPPEMLPRVFDAFTQLDRSLERSRGGLGIGLTLVKQLVEMHGGSVEAHSDGVGRGSEFVVRLPTPTSQPVPGSPATPDDALLKAPGRHRILIEDDTSDVAESMGVLLSMLGYETRTACDGLAGLAAAAEFRPDAALLDIGMPRMNGYDLARRIREQPWGKEMVLIAVTGWGQEEDKQRSREAGFDHHLVKPLDPTALAKLLASMATERGTGPRKSG
jgi:PAS domain S-box-containing protein